MLYSGSVHLLIGYTKLNLTSDEVFVLTRSFCLEKELASQLKSDIHADAELRKQAESSPKRPSESHSKETFFRLTLNRNVE